MGSVQKEDFDSRLLDDLEPLLYEQDDEAFEDLAKKMLGDILQLKDDDVLKNHFKFSPEIDLKKSGLDQKQKRIDELGKLYWQAGFTTPEKKFDMLKQGDYKSNIVIPSNQDAIKFTQKMMIRGTFVLAQFYARNKGTAQTLEDFFTFARKQVEAFEIDEHYESILRTQLFGSATKSLEDEGQVNQMLAATDQFEACSKFGTDTKTFVTDLEYRNFNQIIKNTIKSCGKHMRAKCIVLLLRNGLMRACPLTLLQAAQLAYQHKVDISRELSYLCKQSEACLSIQSPTGSSFEITKKEDCQQKVSFASNDKICEDDRFLSVGAHWYQTSDQRGISKANKNESSGQWDFIETKKEVKYEGVTLLCMNDKLMARHKEAPDQPWVELDKDTLKPKENQVTYIGHNGTDMPLKWMLDTSSLSENSTQGNRITNRIPLYFDGDQLHTLIPYHKTQEESVIVRIALETYQIVNQNELKLERQIFLLDKDNESMLKISELNEQEQTLLASSSCIAVNESMLCIFVSNRIFLFDLSTAGLMTIHNETSSSLTTHYCASDNYFYHMDICSYGWLKRFQIQNFKPKVVDLKSNAIKLPDQPIVFDETKGKFQASIKQAQEKEAEEKLRQPRSNEEEPPQTHFDLFGQLSHISRHSQSMAVKPDCRPSYDNESGLDNVHELSKAMILSLMGSSAHTAIARLKANAHKKLQGKAMLPYYKSRFSVYVNEELLIELRVELEASITKVLQNAQNPNLIELSSCNNLMKLYLANILSLKAIRIDVKELITKDEINLVNKMAEDKLSPLSMLATKDPTLPDLSNSDILLLHVTDRAQELEKLLVNELDFQSKLSKLRNLEESLQMVVASDPSNSLYLSKALHKLSTQDSLKEILEGDLDTIGNCKRVVRLCLTTLNKMFVTSVQRALNGKFEASNFQHIYESLVQFVKNFCKELFFNFGKQLLIIEENQDSEPNKESKKKLKLKTLKEAKDKKKILEELLIDTLILISTQFKEQIFDVCQILWEAKLHTWEDDSGERIKAFFTHFQGMYDTELSLSRVINQMTISICAYTPCVTWLDEIAEALKNCTTALNHFISMSYNYPDNAKLIKHNTMLPYAKQLLRIVSYSLGNVACQLIQRSHTPDDSSCAAEMAELAKLNILQGGIEPRFIPFLSNETKVQIEGSFKITNDEQLKKLALQSAGSVTIDPEDDVLPGLIEKAKGRVGSEVVIGLLQISLQNKRPMVMHAKLGGEDGIRLNRAAFAVILKFSCQEESFKKLVQEVEAAADQVTPGNGDSNKQIIKILEEKKDSQNNSNYTIMLHSWEQASQMRKWTQFLKLKLSERIKKEVSEAYAQELTEAHPSQKTDQYKGSFNEEQKQVIETRSNARFDIELQLQYTEVIEKAKFLIKLQVPQAFLDALMMAEGKQNGQSTRVFSPKNGANAGQSAILQDNHANGAQSARSGRSTVSHTHGPTMISKDGLEMTLLRTTTKKRTILISGSKLGEKDQEVDWRDRLKQWREVQMSQGAVNTLADKNKEVFQSCYVSVLGCLQASFTANQLKQKIEESLINGLRRSAGLQLIRFAMEQCHTKEIFYDMLQWFQGSLRQNKSKTVHYLHGLDGCGAQAQKGIKTQFFAILERILFELKNEELTVPRKKFSDEGDEIEMTDEEKDKLQFEHTDKLTHLLNAICLWDFKLDDHERLSRLNIFQTLLKPNGDSLHLLSKAWGQQPYLEVISDQPEEKFSLTLHLEQAFQFLTRNLIASLIVEDASGKIEAGSETAQSSMAQHKAIFNQAASQQVFSQVLDTIFVNFERYLSLLVLGKNGIMAPTDTDQSNTVKWDVDRQRIDGRRFRIDTRSNPDFEPPFDNNGLCDTYFNEVYGKEKIVEGKRRIAKYLKELKHAKFVEKVTSEEIVKNSDLYKILRKLIGRSVPTTIERVVQRKFDAIDAINYKSWQELGLEEPKLTQQQIHQITEIENEVWLEAQKNAEKPAYLQKKNIQNNNSKELSQLYQEYLSAIKEEWNSAESPEYLEKVDKAYMIPYQDTALFKLLEQLDTYLSLAHGYSTHAFFIAEKVCEPKNLQLLIRLSVQSPPNIQLITHRILQTVLQFDLPVEILDAAVALAEEADTQPQQSSLQLGQTSEVKRLLALRSPLEFQGSKFLQLYFNQLYESRQLMHHINYCHQEGMTSVVDEAVRTIRVSSVIIDKNIGMKQIFDTAVRNAILNDIEKLNEAEIDAIMTLIPEAQFERMAVGTPCLDRDGKRFTVLGIANDDEKISNPCIKSADRNLSYNFKQCHYTIIGLSYDAAAPEQQEIIEEKAYYARTLIDLDPEQAISGARQSLLMDHDVTTKLIKVVIGQAPALTNVRAHEMLKTFVTRGLFAMMHALGSEYVNFIYLLGLQQSFAKHLLEVSNHFVTPKDQKFLVSATHLELSADYFREYQASWCSKEMHRFNKIKIDQDFQGNLLKLVQQQSMPGEEELIKEHSFPIVAKFGELPGFEGDTLDLVAFIGQPFSRFHDQDNKDEPNAMIIDSDGLNRLSSKTLSQLSYASLVITDEGANWSEIWPQMIENKRKQMFVANIQNEEADLQCFVVLNKESHGSLMQLVLQPTLQGEPEKQDKEDKEESKESQEAPKDEEAEAQAAAEKVVDASETPFKKSIDQLRFEEYEIDMEIKGEFKFPLNHYEDLNDNQGEGWNFNNFKEAVYKPVEDIFADHKKEENYYKPVKQVLQQIQQSYSRKLLLMMFTIPTTKTIEQSADQTDDSLRVLRTTDQYSKLCSLLHADYMTMAMVEDKLGQAHPLRDSTVEIHAILKSLRDVESQSGKNGEEKQLFRDFFIKDFNARAHNFIMMAKNIVSDDIVNADKWSEYLFLVDGSELLHPLNLIFFQKAIQLADYVPVGGAENDAKRAKWYVSMFELNLVYTVMFSEAQDGSFRVAALRACIDTVRSIVLHIELYANLQELLQNRIFGNKLVVKLLKCFRDDGDPIFDMGLMVFELLTQLVKVKGLATTKFSMSLDFHEDYSINEHIQKALDNYTVVEQGQAFTNFFLQIQFTAQMQSVEHGHAVRSLGEQFSSDKHRYEGVKFQKTFQNLSEEDMVIQLDSLPESVQIEIFDAENQVISSGIYDANTVANKDKSQSRITVAKAQTAHILLDPPISEVKMAGKLKDVEHSSFKTLSNSSQAAPMRIFASHHQILIQGDSSDGNNLWGQGYRVQGRCSGEDALRKLEFESTPGPIKKVVVGKFARLLLSEDGNIWVNGQCRKHSFGMRNDIDQCQKFQKHITKDFFRDCGFAQEGEQICDMAQGKQQWACVTNKGKVYAAGYLFYREFSEENFYQRTKESYPYNLKLPRGFEARKVWLQNRTYNIYVLAEKVEDKTMHTLFAGNRSNHQRPNNNGFVPIPGFPEGSYLTSIADSDRYYQIGIDEKQQLWIFYSQNYQYRATYDLKLNQDEELFLELDEDRDKMVMKAYQIQWFTKNELKVTKADCGMKHMVVQTTNKDGKVEFYCIANDLDDHIANSYHNDKMITKVYKNLIGKIEVNPETVKDFSCSLEATFFLMSPVQSKTPSIIPDKPDAEGLIHFYKDLGSESWKFLSQEEYEAQKGSLPDLCFATRHKIKDFASKTFPNLLDAALNQAIQTPALNSLIDTATGQSFKNDQPLYYSYAKISGEEQKIYANEEQVLKSHSQGQKWDLNPLIFYRIKKASVATASLLNQLRILNPTEYFIQSSKVEIDQLRFSFERKELTEADFETLPEIPDAIAKILKNVTTEFGQAENEEMLQAIDKMLKSAEFSQLRLEEIRPERLIIQKGANGTFRTESPLQDFVDQVLQIRKDLLIKFSQAWSSLMNFVRERDVAVEGSLSQLFMRRTDLVLPSILNEFVDERFCKIEKNYDCPTVEVSRRKAMMFADTGKVDHAGTQTVFGQIITQLAVIQPNMHNFIKRDIEVKCFKLNFLGEGGIDDGGLFRDCLVNITQELEALTLPLLQKTPNNKSDFGNYRECFILNSQARSPVHLKMFKFLGALIGFSILSKQPLALNMAPTFWKQIAGQTTMTLEDLNSIDTYSYNNLKSTREFGGALSDEDFAASIDLNFTTVLSSGDEVSLCPGGETKQVTKQNMDEFINLLLQARSAETSDQMQALMSGVEIALQGQIQALAYLQWESIEARACGAKIFDVEKLRSITEYPNCANDHRIVGRFWKAFESFNEVEKAQYLKFVWGRTRLPLDCSYLNQKHEVRLMDDMSKTAFPQSHTCYFQLDIPNYSTDEICRQRIVQAAELCGQIDNDNNYVADEEI